jgi:hypothetical protein
MTKTKLRLFIFTAFFCFALSSFAQIKDVIKINGTFMDFNKAVEKNDDIAALKYVDENSIKYFDLILEYCNNTNAPENDSTYITNKKFVGWLQLNLPSATYKSINGTELLQLIIKNGLFQKLNLGRFHPGQIKINEDKVVALLTTFSSDEKTTCIFNKVKKAWKIDLSSIIPYLVVTMPK